LTGAFLVSGVSAWYLLRSRETGFARRTLSLGMASACVLIAAQVFVGDLVYGKMLEHQPAKMQAAEGFWEHQSASPAPYLWIIVPDQEHQRNLVQLGTPHLGSIWLTHSLDGRVAGLTNTPVDQQPMMAPVFYGFRTMYVIAMAMFALSVVSLWLRWHDRLYSTRWFLRALVWMTPSGFVATLAGWYTAEIGRQPYLIHGLLRTADSLSPVPAATMLLTLVTFVCAYTVFGSAFLIFTLRLIRRGPSGLPGYALPAGSLKRALRPVIGGVREHLPSRE
jgi:cytochrome bd ubiquinol oxidase subunit I